MSMTELKVSFPTKKLDALRFYMDKKQQTMEQELKDCLDKTYEKTVPAQVREYLESRMNQAPTQQQAPESGQTPVARERPVRPTRRQREQEAPEPVTVPEAQTEADGTVQEEGQGMTMSM